MISPPPFCSVCAPLFAALCSRSLSHTHIFTQISNLKSHSLPFPFPRFSSHTLFCLQKVPIHSSITLFTHTQIHIHIHIHLSHSLILPFLHLQNSKPSFWWIAVHALTYSQGSRIAPFANTPLPIHLCPSINPPLQTTLAITPIQEKKTTLPCLMKTIQQTSSPS